MHDHVGVEEEHAESDFALQIEDPLLQQASVAASDRLGEYSCAQGFEPRTQRASRMCQLSTQSSCPAITKLKDATRKGAGSSTYHVRELEAHSREDMEGVIKLKVGATDVVARVKQ